MPEETKKQNRGVLPTDYSHEFLTLDIGGNMQSEIKSSEIPETIFDDVEPQIGQNGQNVHNVEVVQDVQDGQALQTTLSTENPHIRHPHTRKSGTLIVMAVSAVCGAAGGVIISQNSTISDEVTQALSLSFGEVFAARLLVGGILLAVEFVLGFFAMGDLLVWTVPLASGLGLSLRVAAQKTWALLPSSLIVLGITAFAAAVSAGFSQMLMSISRGGTVHLGSSPRRVYVLNFLGYLAAVIACALYEGIILNVNK